MPEQTTTATDNHKTTKLLETVVSDYLAKFGGDDDLTDGEGQAGTETYINDVHDAHVLEVGHGCIHFMMKGSMFEPIENFAQRVVDNASSEDSEEHVKLRGLIKEALAAYEKDERPVERLL